MCVLKVFAQMIHFVSGDAPTHVAPVFPTLVLEVRTEADGAASLGGWAFAVFLGQGASLYCGKFGKLVEKRLTRIGGMNGWLVQSKLSRMLDTINSGSSPLFDFFVLHTTKKGAFKDN